MSRYAAYVASIVLTAFFSFVGWLDADWWWVAVAFGALALLGTWDMLQRRSTLRRNYPILAHLRYGLESIGPEMRQYFIEADTAEVPFSRQQRALVYQRSKAVNDTRPFGTQQDVYGVDYEWINHSLITTHIASHDFRLIIGERAKQPYSASVRSHRITARRAATWCGNWVRAISVVAIWMAASIRSDSPTPPRCRRCG